MRTYNITEDIYFKMIERVSQGDCKWDCIELEDGCAIAFRVINNAPRFIEVFDEDDNILEHDFSMTKFNQLAS